MTTTGPEAVQAAGLDIDEDERDVESDDDEDDMQADYTEDARAAIRQWSIGVANAQVCAHTSLHMCMAAKFSCCIERTRIRAVGCGWSHADQRAPLSAPPW